MLRLAKVLVVIFLLTPISASPLGLGDLELDSALNQQLDAEIDLVSLGQTRIEDIKVSLASREAFERAGIARPLFLSRLQFEVEAGPDNTARIKVSSDQPVREPFLDFLVEVNWPSGRLLREYTVLLDPPTFLEEKPSAIQAPASAGGTAAEPETTRSEPVPAPAVSATTAGAEATAPVSDRLHASVQVSPEEGWSYGPVQRSDTLWSIAEEYRAGDDSVTVEQVMMALLRSNPEAFYNNNINELRAGHVLRIEDPSSVGQISRAAAAAEARRQYAQWQDTKSARAGSADPRAVGDQDIAAPPAGGAAATAAAAAESGPRLRLSAPDAADAERFSTSAAETDEAGQPSAAAVDSLREELTAALEVSESARQENIELRQRLAELEEQISSMQRLLSLQDDTMAAMQAGAAAEAEVQPGESEAQPEAQSAQSSTSAQPSTPAAPPTSANLLDNLRSFLNDPMMLGAGGIVLLLLLTLGWLVVRKRRGAEEGFDSLTETEQAEDFIPAAAVAPAEAGIVASEQPPAGLEDSVLDDTVADSGDGEDLGLDIMQTDEDEIDILAEADVYLAYRRFDKAEELLRDAVNNEPGRRDLVLKLFEVYAGSANTEAFIAEAESLRISLGDDEQALWNKVVAMGRQLAPDHPLFNGGEAPDTEPQAAALQLNDTGDTDRHDGMELDFTTEPDLSEPEFAAAQSGEPIEQPVEQAAEAQPEVQQEQPAEALPTEDDSRIAAFSAEPPVASEAPADLDLTLDDETLASLETGIGETAGTEQQTAAFQDETPAESNETGDEPSLTVVSEAEVQSDTAFPADAEDQLQDDELEKQLLAAGSREGGDVDWLEEIGNDLDFSNMEGDEAGGDFSGLISGEDEIGTKLDLARAYIDMGDQDSARNILNEVTEEGNEAQQAEANDLIARIG